MRKIQITHFYHSGFMVETLNNILVFDYYKGLVSDEFLKSEKNIFVFVSHKHEDHFNKEIFNWRKNNSNIKYILSNDIKESIEKKYDNMIYMKKWEKINIDGICVKAYGSTDEGISFQVYVDGINLFHAGDLNWWHWKEDSKKENDFAEKWFKKEVEHIIEEKIDLAFFPVDPRQEEFYYLGAEYFIEKIKPKVFIPMHFGDELDIPCKIIRKINSYNTKIINLNKVEQIIEV